MYKIQPMTLVEISRIEREVNVSTLSRFFKREEHGVHLKNGRISGIEASMIKKRWAERHPELFKPTFFVGANLCGGSHKSSITVGLMGASYRISGGKEGVPHILIDTDSQASATGNMLGDDFVKAGDYEPLVAYFEEKIKLPQLLKEVQGNSNLWVIPSSLDNIVLDKTMLKPADLKTKVLNLYKDLLTHFKTPVSVFIDTPPALSNAFFSSLLAMQQIDKGTIDPVLVIPVRPDITSIRGSEIIIKESNELMAAFNYDLSKIRTQVVLSGLDRRQPGVVGQAMRAIVASTDSSPYVSPITLRHSSEVIKSWNTGTSIYDRKSLRSDLSSEMIDLWLSLKDFNGKVGNA